MAKKNYLSDLLIKLSTVFPKDAYIINNMYCMEGPLSKPETAGYYLCALTPEVTNYLKEELKSNEIVYLKSIKNAKTDFNEPNVQILKNEDDIYEIEENMKKLKSIVMDPSNEWKQFNFTEEELISLFDDCKFVTLFANDSLIPPISISKSLLPLMTKKNMNSSIYTTKLCKGDEELTKLIIDFDHELFHMYMMYEYLNPNRD